MPHHKTWTGGTMLLILVVMMGASVCALVLAVLVVVQAR